MARLSDEMRPLNGHDRAVCTSGNGRRRPGRRYRPGREGTPHDTRPGGCTSHEVRVPGTTVHEVRVPGATVHGVRVHGPPGTGTATGPGQPGPGSPANGNAPGPMTTRLPGISWMAIRRAGPATRQVQFTRLNAGNRTIRW